MPRFRTRPALALLCLLLCLTACAPTAIGGVSPTATVSVPPTPMATSTPAWAPTASNIPAGWKVVVETYFSLAYPSDWTLQEASGQRYFIYPPSEHSEVIVVATVGDVSPYCLSATSGAQHTTFAGLPMTYLLTGEGNALRTWLFANKQRTLYSLQAEDTQASASLQAQDEAIFATFRPDNADPWRC